MAGLLWLLGLVGVAPSDEQLDAYDREFRQRRHHVGIDFATTHDDDSSVGGLTLGLSYEYLIDRPFHATSFEILGQTIGEPIRSKDIDFWLGGGVAYYPIRNLKFFAQAGALFDEERTYLRGRVGLGYRLMFFMVAAMPYVYVENTDSGDFTWSLGARIQY